MSAPKIRHRLKEARRFQRRQLERLRTSPAPLVTVLQDERTKVVLGVAINRGVVEKLYERLKAEGVDYSYAECIDFPVVV